MVYVEPRKRVSLIAVSCLVVVVACSGTPAVEWIAVGVTGPLEEGFVTYAGPATIRKSGDTVRMFSVIDSEVVNDAESDRRRVSWKDEWEYDCQGKQHRPIQYTEYSGRMGTGEKMFSITTPAIVFWLPVKPGSIGDRLWKIACGEE
jgi:surface-adhesin protein E